MYLTQYVSKTLQTVYTLEPEAIFMTAMAVMLAHNELAYAVTVRILVHTGKTRIKT